MFDVAVEQIVKVKPPKTAVVYKALLIIGCIVAATTIPVSYTHLDVYKRQISGRGSCSWTWRGC